MEELPVDTFPYLFAGYSVIWALLVLYIGLLGRRVRRLEQRGSERPDQGQL
jgi:CcmD family protein